MYYSVYFLNNFFEMWSLKMDQKLCELLFACFVTQLGVYSTFQAVTQKMTPKLSLFINNFSISGSQIVQVHQLSKVMRSPVCLFCIDLGCNPTGCLSSLLGSRQAVTPKIAQKITLKIDPKIAQ